MVQYSNYQINSDLSLQSDRPVFCENKTFQMEDLKHPTRQLLPQNIKFTLHRFLTALSLYSLLACINSSKYFVKIHWSDSFGNINLVLEAGLTSTSYQFPYYHKYESKINHYSMFQFFVGGPGHQPSVC